jgi:hypothetical protein
VANKHKNQPKPDPERNHDGGQAAFDAVESAPPEVTDETLADAAAEGGQHVYPPPTSDQAGERTANVAPVKQLPTAPPAEENPEPEAKTPSAGEAIQAADAEFARLRAENDDLKARLAKYEPAPRAAAEGKKKFTVAVPGHSLPTTTVEAADEGGAVKEYQRIHGVHHMPAQPTVTEATE